MNIAPHWQKNDLLAQDHAIFNKVPKVTLYFWIIKILCVAVGETAADVLSSFFDGSTVTLITGFLLLVTLFLQIALKKYIAGIYWLVILLMGTLGTLIADSLTNNLGIPLPLTITVLSLLLIITFVVWHASQNTLSATMIFTIQQEGFYWFAILLLFIGGIASDDFISNTVNVDTVVLIIILGMGIALSGILYWRFKLNATLTFWIVYILTHPLGSILGAFLTDLSPWKNPLIINVLFLSIIFILVIYLTYTHKDISAPTKSPTVKSGNVSPQEHMKARSKAQEAHKLNISTMITKKWTENQLDFDLQAIPQNCTQAPPGSRYLGTQATPERRSHHPLEEENLRLKQENAMLRQECDTLKNAMRIFLHNQQ
jgi:uncharacterized membrane-anchored protein